MGWRPDPGIFPSSPSDTWPHTLLGLRRFFVGKEITNLSEANSLHTYQTTWTSAKAWNSKIEHPRGTESCFPVFKSAWEQKFLHCLGCSLLTPELPAFKFMVMSLLPSRPFPMSAFWLPCFSSSMPSLGCRWVGALGAWWGTAVTHVVSDFPAWACRIEGALKNPFLPRGWSVSSSVVSYSLWPHGL